MVLISGIYYQMIFKNITSLSSFNDLIKTWEAPQCQCLMYGDRN